MDDQSGDSLVGRTVSHYRVVAPLGAGGMGVVYRGEDVRLSRPVAIKFVADEFADDAQAVGRLRAEARAASALNHPNICTIYDIGTHEGRPFIVMELMEGQTLRERLTRGRLKVHEIVDVGIQIADALQGAHAAGIIHRDIKPANIFLTGRGQVKILDFGLAKLATEQQPGADSVTLATNDHTAAGTTLGTVSYMSPEQATGEELDGRTDLFSLGVVIYECAAGRQPFQGKTHAVILSAILNNAPLLPGTLNPELPARLQDVIMTCLEKDRELRYQSAADLRADLKRVRRDLESGRTAADTVSRNAVTAVTSRVPTDAASDSGAPTASVMAPTPVSSRAVAASSGERRLLLTLGVLGVAAVVVAGAFALWPRGRVTRTDTREASAATSSTVQERLALAESSLTARDYRSAQAYAAEVLAISPDHPAALAIHREVAAVLLRSEEAVNTARQRLNVDDLQGAARALAGARDIDPTAPAISEVGAALAERIRDIQSAPTRDPRTPTVPAPPAAAPRDRASARTGTEAVAPPPVPAAPERTAPVAPVVEEPQVTTAPPPPPSPEPAPSSAVRPPAGRADSAPASPPPAELREAVPAGHPAADDNANIRRVIADYGRAIETKDLGLFRSVKPNLSREEERRLQEWFRAVTSQKVAITVLSIDLRDPAATVVVRRRDAIDAGGRQQTLESQQTFRLTHVAAGWVIADIR
jgi:serine/threonine protein kinase